MKIACVAKRAEDFSKKYLEACDLFHISRHCSRVFFSDLFGRQCCGQSSTIHEWSQFRSSFKRFPRRRKNDEMILYSLNKNVNVFRKNFRMVRVEWHLNYSQRIGSLSIGTAIRTIQGLRHAAGEIRGPVYPRFNS